MSFAKEHMLMLQTVALKYINGLKVCSKKSVKENDSPGPSGRHDTAILCIAEVG